jgi:kumamolisin
VKIPARILPILATLAALAAQLLPATSAAAEPRVTFHNSVAPLPAPVAATQRAVLAVAQTDQMEFGVSMQLRNYAQMQARIARGEIIPRSELERVYLPLQSDYDAVVKWLTGEGFTITQHDPSRLVVYASGTLAQVQKSLQVHLVTVTANGGQTYQAADTAPSLPLSIATPVLGINHLQPFHIRKKHGIRLPLTNNAPPFKIKEILAAYNGGSLTYTGANQKIAILIDTTAKASDLTAFWSANSITRTGAIENINVNGGTLPAVSGEETLDVEWSSGVAPGATIRVYASRTLNDADLDKCLQRIINDLPTQPNLHQLSISLGLGETYGTTAQFNTDAQLFATLASGGVSIFVSSGDGGSTPDSNGGSTGPLQVEHYASDTNVTAVGGTSIFVNTTTGARTSEAAWSGSGGGVSVIFNRPTWQTGTGVPTGTKRFVPDVCLAADPNTGAYVYLNGAVQQYGGTSWSAPAWAGFCALINEARATAGKPALGLINPSLYPLIGTNNFVDVTTGNNATNTSGGKYAATTGYDEVTGIGAPHMANLLATLAAQAAAAPTITSFTPTSGVQNTTVVITGTNFGSASAVKFNGTTATFTVNSPTQITTASPAGAATGTLSVTTPGGTATSSASFTVVAGAPAPSIAGFSPAYGLPASSVVITGTNFTGATSVTFNGITAAAFTVNSATQVTATVPASATTGPIAVTTPSGPATSSTSFTVLTGDGTPTIASFSPTAGTVGTNVTITGTNFVNVSSVTFGGVAAVAPTVVSATQITVAVPSGAVTGPIGVVTGLGSATSTTNFTVGAAPVSAIVISQIYGGGGNTSAPYLNDYIELYNRSAGAVDITGWSVQYAASTGTSWTPVALTGTMQPGHYFLIKGNSSGAVGTALPAADATNTNLALSATKGKVALLNVSTAITAGTSSPVGLATLVDFVGYGSADAYEGTGAAPAPSSTTAALRLNAGATDAGDNASDFTTGAPNPRNSATGVVGPDLTIAKTHTGSFLQGDTGKTYTLTVTNNGSAATSGTVTVTDALPTGLTATAFSGTGWTTTLGTLTATRSDALAAGASYPPLTVTVSVAANATSVTNVASVSGGGETNPANDSASDPTTISSSGGNGTPVVIASWDVSGQTNFGTSPLAATANANVTVGGLTRGSGVGTTGGATSAAWGGFGFGATSAAASVTANAYVSFTATPKSGFTASFTELTKFDFRRSGSGPQAGVLQYQIGATGFVNITILSYGTGSSTTSGSLGPVDLSGISALQNIAAGTVVTFRIVNYNGAAAGTGTWYIYDLAGTTAADFAISGTVNPVTVPLTPSQSWRQQWFGDSSSTGAGADTAIPANDGIPNLMKYALNLTPPQTPTTTASAAVVDETTGFLRLTVTRNAAATDVTFVIESTSDLSDPNSWSTTGIVLDQNTSTTLQAHDTTPLTSGPRFIRLTIKR